MIKNFTFYASKLIIHPEFNNTKTTLTPGRYFKILNKKKILTLLVYRLHKKDIGLIKLNKHVNCTQDINIVCLPDAEKIENKQVIVLGWYMHILKFNNRIN